MNAHTPIRHAAVPLSEVAAMCPVEVLAREISRLEQLIDENDQRPTATAADRDFALRTERQLADRVDCLEHQLEWVRPLSLAGVYALLVRLQSLARDAGAAEECPVFRSNNLRRFDRLHDLALEGLERLGGIDGGQLGKPERQNPYKIDFMGLVIDR